MFVHVHVHALLCLALPGLFCRGTIHVQRNCTYWLINVKCLGVVDLRQVLMVWFFVCCTANVLVPSLAVPGICLRLCVPYISLRVAYTWREERMGRVPYGLPIHVRRGAVADARLGRQTPGVYI